MSFSDSPRFFPCEWVLLSQCVHQTQVIFLRPFELGKVQRNSKEMTSYTSLSRLKHQLVTMNCCPPCVGWMMVGCVWLVFEVCAVVSVWIILVPEFPPFAAWLPVTVTVTVCGWFVVCQEDTLKCHLFVTDVVQDWNSSDEESCAPAPAALATRWWSACRKQTMLPLFRALKILHECNSTSTRDSRLQRNHNFSINQKNKRIYQTFGVGEPRDARQLKTTDQVVARWSCQKRQPWRAILRELKQKRDIRNGNCSNTQSSES